MMAYLEVDNYKVSKDDWNIAENFEKKHKDKQNSVKQWRRQ
jgi:hypothetical protein